MAASYRNRGGARPAGRARGALLHGAGGLRDAFAHGAYPVAARLLGLLHRDARVADELVRRARVHRVHGHAHAGRDEAVRLATKAGEAALEKLRKGEAVAELTLLLGGSPQ